MTSRAKFLLIILGLIWATQNQYVYLSWIGFVLLLIIATWMCLTSILGDLQKEPGELTMDNEQLKWDNRFMDMAFLVSRWSKDPSTKVGAVIVDQNNRVVSVGYNGFAKWGNDSKERYDDRNFKYKGVIHAEENALLFANQSVE